MCCVHLSDIRVTNLAVASLMLSPALPERREDRKKGRKVRKI